MIVWLDHLVFGNGRGLKTPAFDGAFHMLDGELYVFSGGLGSQLCSFQWTHPKPGEQRVLLGRRFVVFQSHRRGPRVSCSWRLQAAVEGVDEYQVAIRDFRRELERL